MLSKAFILSVETQLIFSIEIQFVIKLFFLVTTGQLKVLVNHLKSPDAPVLPSRVLEKIQQLQAKADKISDITTPYIRATQPTYYQREYFFHIDQFSIQLLSNLVLGNCVMS